MSEYVKIQMSYSEGDSMQRYFSVLHTQLSCVMYSESGAFDCIENTGSELL